MSRRTAPDPGRPLEPRDFRLARRQLRRRLIAVAFAGSLGALIALAAFAP